jgi:L-malate glycosyltransferase
MGSETRRLRICYLGDPRSIHTQRWVRWFAERHDVSLISTAEDDALADVEICALKDGGLPGTRLARAVSTVRRVVARERPDVVHAHYINEPGWFAASSGAQSVVITAWGSDVYRAPGESRLARRLNPWAVRRADWVTCDSDDQARVLRSWTRRADRVAVVGWGVDRSEFHTGVDGAPMRERLEVPGDARVVLSPRQWLPNSNIDAVVAAHAQLPEDVYLVLKRLPRFERGSSAEVERAVATSPARSRIRVVGELDAANLPALYAAADAVVSLCTTDGTPVSVLEAMAVGKPVVALRNASVAEWVSEPGGALLEALSPGDVASALSAALEGGEPRARAAAHNVGVVAARADREVEMARVEEIYSRLASRSSTP